MKDGYISLTYEDKVNLNIRDFSGKLIAMPIEESRSHASKHLIEFNSDQLSEGVCNYFLKTSSAVENRRLIII